MVPSHGDLINEPDMAEQLVADEVWDAHDPDDLVLLTYRPKEA
jgi:hypothetical protein